MARLRDATLVGLMGLLVSGCGRATSEPSSIGRFTVRMEVTSPGPPAAWTGFYLGHDGGVDLEGTTPSSHEFPDQRFEGCGSRLDACLQLSAMARPVPPSTGPLTVCLTLVGKGRRACGSSPTPQGDAVALVFGDD